MKGYIDRCFLYLKSVIKRDLEAQLQPPLLAYERHLCNRKHRYSPTCVTGVRGMLTVNR